MYRPRYFALLLLALCLLPLFLARPANTAASNLTKAWRITLEEPTGIYRRDNEIVTVKLTFQPGEARADQLHVLSATGQEILSQLLPQTTHADGSLKTAELLFPATIVPGDRPEYVLIAETKPAEKAARANAAAHPLVARRIGVGRVEMANDRFGVMLNLGLENTEPALVAAFNKTAGPQRMLNLVDTSPDVKEPLAHGKQSAGWGSFLAGQIRNGAFDQVEILEAGPLRARVRLSGARFGEQRESWEFVWQAGSPVLHWRAELATNTARANYGFFFSSLSAAPYEPFNRWMEGVELKFPDGWETDNPPDHKIGLPDSTKDFADLPGRHVVYYQREENYGAFGLLELDPNLQWKGVGGRQLYAITELDRERRVTEIALAFPRWKGTETVLEARAEYRKFLQPILSVVTPVSEPNTQSWQPLPQRNDQVQSKPVSQLPRAEQVFSHSLNGAWKLQHAEKSDGERQGFFHADFDDANWRTVQVPGTVHTQILEAPKFFTREAEWISAKEWWYRRKFTAPPAAQNADGTSGNRVWLKFDATDYYADIYLNGQLLTRHEGYIDPYQIEVTGKLNRSGENVLAIRVWTPISYYWRHRPYTVKGSYGAVDQKPDNITPLGITRPVSLLVTGSVIIDDLAIDTRLNKDGSADVIVDLELNTTSAQETSILLTLAPRNFSAPNGLALKSTLSLPAGVTTQRFLLHVENPALWWTWDHGKPNLYTLSLKLTQVGSLSDARSLAVGIREIEHIDWKFYLNGKRMFIRGTNYYYHLFQSEVRRGDYDRDIGLMRQMNINMIRLHCNFSNPEFYDVCDEQGILIWQDFLEAWYPEDRAFSLKAAQLYDPHIKYVRNHPAVALWATSDEESLENYRDLTKHLEPRLYAQDPQRRPVQRSTGRYGDAHVYEGWYGGTIWAYTRVNEKFISELGATALPNYDSVLKFLPNHWPIKDHENEWVFRKLQIFEAMRAWGEPGTMTLQEYIPQTQDYVARLFQLAIERMRRLKYQPSGGILHFHALDLWPSVTMAALDFYRQPTKAFYTVQRSFQMVLPSFAYDRDTWQTGETVKAELWLINDHWFAVPNASVSWRVEDSSKQTVHSGNATNRLTLAADSVRQFSDVSFTAGKPGKYTLWATIRDERGQVLAENCYEFRVQ